MIKTYKQPHKHTHTRVPSGNPSCYRLITPALQATSLYSPSHPCTESPSPPALQCHCSSTLPNNSLLSLSEILAQCPVISSSKKWSAIDPEWTLEADQREAIRAQNGALDMQIRPLKALLAYKSAD